MATRYFGFVTWLALSRIFPYLKVRYRTIDYAYFTTGYYLLTLNYFLNNKHNTNMKNNGLLWALVFSWSSQIVQLDLLLKQASESICPSKCRPIRSSERIVNMNIKILKLSRTIWLVGKIDPEVCFSIRSSCKIGKNQEKTKGKAQSKPLFFIFVLCLLFRK